MTDDDLLTTHQLAVEMLRAAPQPMELVLRPHTAFQLAGLVQLALRHPDISGDVRQAGVTFVAAVREYFTVVDAKACVAVLDKGSDPAQDRPLADKQ